MVASTIGHDTAAKPPCKILYKAVIGSLGEPLLKSFSG